MEDSDRLRRYGQEDHFRIYGTDYAEQLREVVFIVAVRGMVDMFDEKSAQERLDKGRESIHILARKACQLWV